MSGTRAAAGRQAEGEAAEDRRCRYCSSGSPLAPPRRSYEHGPGLIFASLIRHCPAILTRFQLPVQFLHPSPSSVRILTIVAVAVSDECTVALVSTFTL